MKQFLIFLLICLFAGVSLSKEGYEKGETSTVFRGKDYVFNVGKMNWFAGYSYCDQLNMKMISLETIAKNREFSDLLKFHGMNDKYIWLAGNRLEDEETFRWRFGGHPISYTNWGVGQPDNKGGKQYCLKINAANKWDDDDCFKINYVVCVSK